MKTYPRNPQLMATRAKRFQNMPSFMWTIDGILVLECKTVLKAYYGGYVRAGLTLIKEGIYFGVHGLWWHCVYRFCDFAGWTRLIPIKPGSKLKIRHGRDCSPNCQDLDCLDKAPIPQWYRKLFKVRKSEEPE